MRALIRRSRKASTTALTIAGVDPIEPASPIPLTPIGLTGLGVSVLVFVSIRLVPGDAITARLGPEAGLLTPDQRAWIEEDVAQCGYCQPGMILELRALLRRKPKATLTDVDEALSDHVCRCGSYPRIRKAALLAARNGGGQ